MFEMNIVKGITKVVRPIIYFGGHQYFRYILLL